MIAPDRRLAQPGPPAPARWESVAGAARSLDLVLASGATLHDAVAGPLAAAGIEGAALTLTGGSFAPFAYVRPALSADPRYAAYYSETFRPDGEVRLEVANVTYGQRDGAPFLHCHAVWIEPDGSRRGGHILPQEAVIRQPPQARAWSAAEIAVAAQFDPETNFTLFHPARRPAGETAPGAPRLVAARIRPNTDATAAVEGICREHGIRSAVVRGSVGSLAGAMFCDGSFVPDIATEVLVLSGEVAPDDAGELRARLDIALADTAGEIHRGELVPGANPVCITFELMLEERA